MAAWPRVHFPGESAGTGWLAARWPGMQVAPASVGVSGAPDWARRPTEGPQLPPYGARGRVVDWGVQLAWDCSTVPSDRPLFCGACLPCRELRVSGESVGTPSDPS